MSIALVVGPGVHFGKELCRELALHGYDIAIISRSEALDESIRNEVEASGRRFVAVRADVRHTQLFEQAMLDVAGVDGDVGCIIYNVKFSPKGPALTMPPEVLTEALAANVSASLCVLRAAPNLMRNADQRVVVLTGGGFMRNPDYSRMPLSLSKAAIHTMVNTLRLPLQQQHQIDLKTLTIDGVVRPSGPILPSEVANKFLNLINSRTRSAMQLGVTEDDGQLAIEMLFGEKSDADRRS